MNKSKFFIKRGENAIIGKLDLRAGAKETLFHVDNACCLWRQERIDTGVRSTGYTKKFLSC